MSVGFELQLSINHFNGINNICSKFIPMGTIKDGVNIVTMTKVINRWAPTLHKNL